MVQSGSLPCSQLVTLTAAELASTELKAQRDLLTTQDLESRRLDWLEEHKAEIQLDIGVDPANQWQYDNEDDKLSEPDADQPDV
ncbi:hypothetical protein EON65_52590 [archaeon]|nr:MAG: hypothetical protein EON65_52590 [archaeon]